MLGMATIINFRWKFAFQKSLGFYLDGYYYWFFLVFARHWEAQQVMCADSKTDNRYGFWGEMDRSLSKDNVAALLSVPAQKSVSSDYFNHLHWLE